MSIDWLDNPLFPTVLAGRKATTMYDAQLAGDMAASVVRYERARLGDLDINSGGYGGISAAEANRMPLTSARFFNNTNFNLSTNNQTFNALAYARVAHTSAFASMLHRNLTSIVVDEGTAAMSALTAQYNEIVRVGTAAGNRDAITLNHNEYAAINLSAGTITNMYMTLNEASWGGTSAEVVTNFYGWYMEDLTSYVTAGRIGTLWNIYAVAGNSAFGGKVRIGSLVAPTNALDVVGGGTFSTRLAIGTTTLHATDELTVVGTATISSQLMVGSGTLGSYALDVTGDVNVNAAFTTGYRVGASLGGIYVHRDTDPAAHDYSLATFTTDGTTRDLDISSIVPAGAKAVVLKVQISDDAVGTGVWFIPNGNTNFINALVVQTQVVGVTVQNQGIVRLDTNRIISYWATNTTWSTLYVHVIGWYM